MPGEGEGRRECYARSAADYACQRISVPGQLCTEDVYLNLPNTAMSPEACDLSATLWVWTTCRFTIARNGCLGLGID